MAKVGALKQLSITSFMQEEDPPSMMPVFCFKAADEYLLKSFFQPAVQRSCLWVHGRPLDRHIFDLVQMSVTTSVSSFGVAGVPGFCSPPVTCQLVAQLAAPVFKICLRFKQLPEATKAKPGP